MEDFAPSFLKQKLDSDDFWNPYISTEGMWLVFVTKFEISAAISKTVPELMYVL